MRVFVPLDIESHSYLDLLYRNLKNIGVDSYGLTRFQDLKNILKADIIHIHWIEFFIRTPDSFFSTITRFIGWIMLFTSAKYLLNKKIVITLHNLKPHETVYPFLEKFGFWYYFKISNATIVHNDWSKKQILHKCKMLNEKIVIIPHGNFVGYYPNKISKKNARDVLKIPSDAFTVLYLGKIKKYKGLDILLSALNSIKCDNLWIVISGKPEDEDVKQKLLDFRANFPNCILNLNYVPDKEIQIHMNSCDVGVLPYDDITTSGSLLLFGSFKKTVIVPSLEPIKETFGNTVFYYSKGDTNSLKETLKSMKKVIVYDKNEEIFTKTLEYNWVDIAGETSKLYESIKTE